MFTLIKRILAATEEFLLTQLKPKATVGLVGGSDFDKIAEQMGGDDGKIELKFLIMILTDKLSIEW